MTAGLGLLGAERRAKCVDAAKRRSRGLPVELAGLGEVGRAQVEILGREQPTPLADRRGQDRRVDADKIPFVEEIVDRLLDFIPNSKDRHLPTAPQPQMAMLHQKIDTMLL